MWFNLFSNLLLSFFLQERERMLVYFQDLKVEMNKLRDGERVKFIKMIVESNIVIKIMKFKVEKVCLVKINVESN